MRSAQAQEDSAARTRWMQAGARIKFMRSLLPNTRGRSGESGQQTSVTGEPGRKTLVTETGVSGGKSRRGRLGMQWELIGSTRPDNGKEIFNPKLAEALLLHTEFTPDEFDAFKVHDLCTESFIETGKPGSRIKAGQFYRPLPPPVFLKGIKYMAEFNGKEVTVLERFGGKTQVRLVETSQTLMVDTHHLCLADNTRWDPKNDDSEIEHPEEHIIEQMMHARAREGAEPLEFEGEGSEGSDHSDSADEADPPRPLCRVETGGDIGLIKGDVDIELMFAKTMSDIPDLERFKRNVLKDILTAVQYKRTELVFVYTLWDLLPVENDNQTSLANHVVARVRILENSLRLNSIPEGQKNWIRSAPDVFRALWRQFGDEESLLLSGSECNGLLSIRLLIDQHTAEGKKELECAGLTGEHCEGRHRSITGKSGTAKWVEAHKQLELSLATAAATAKDQVQRSQVALEEDVRAALKDGIISEEEQEVLEQKKDMLKAAKQIYAMLKSAKELNSAAWLDAKKAIVMRRQVEAKQLQHASMFNNVVSGFELELSLEGQNQYKARSTLDEVIADVEQHKQKQESESFNKVLAEIRDIHLGKGMDEQDFSLNERDAVLVDRERRNQELYEIGQAEESAFDRLIVEVEQKQQAFQPENGSDAPSTFFDEVIPEVDFPSACRHKIEIEQVQSMFDRLIAEVEQKHQAFHAETGGDAQARSTLDEVIADLEQHKQFFSAFRKALFRSFRHKILIEQSESVFDRLIAEVEQKQQAFQKETETETEKETVTEKSQQEMSMSRAYCVGAEERCLFPTNVTPCHSKGTMELVSEIYGFLVRHQAEQTQRFDSVIKTREENRIAEEAAERERQEEAESSIIAPNALPATRFRGSVQVDQQSRDQVIGRDKRDQIIWREAPDSKLNGSNLGKEKEERASDRTGRLKREVSNTESIDEVIPEVDFLSAFRHTISIEPVESVFDRLIAEVEQKQEAPEVEFFRDFRFRHKISIEPVESDSSSASFDELIAETEQQTHQESSLQRDSDSDPAPPPYRTHCDLMVPPHLRSRAGIVNPTQTKASQAIHMQTMATHIADQSDKPKYATNPKIKPFWLI